MDRKPVSLADTFGGANSELNIQRRLQYIIEMKPPEGVVLTFPKSWAEEDPAIVLAAERFPWCRIAQ